MNTKIFENTEIAFKLKTNSQLKRAYLLFKMISFPALVKFGSAAAKISLKLNLPVKGLIRSTVFDHFCAGVNETDCLPVIKKLYEYKVASVLDYSVEGKKSKTQFDSALQKTLEIVNFVNTNDAMSITVFKPTGLGRFDLFVKKSEGIALSKEELSEWDRVVRRFHEICQLAKTKNIKVLIDAEESWMQNAADELVEEMMQTYNKDTAVVYNTVQTYRWDRLEYLKQLHQRSKTDGFKIGVKIVRGAYMEKERDRAEEKGYQSPICKDKSTTDINFNTTLKYILNHLSDISLFIGTHNEASNYLAMSLMKELNIARNNNNIWFGQLYGMSDHISFNLAAEGYNVAKYVPFGPVKDVMPYLIRRAQENTSVAGQTGRELSLIKKERQRRKEL